jgi:ABC-type dipeptide/oligopeptide/nickel transport system ATPase component
LDDALEKIIINIDGDIHFDNVSFHYPARKDVLILQNLILVARAGKTTALVGSSGCGKSFRKLPPWVILSCSGTFRQEHLYLAATSLL